LGILHAAELSAFPQRKSSGKWLARGETVSRAWAGFDGSGKESQERSATQAAGAAA